MIRKFLTLLFVSLSVVITVRGETVAGRDTLQVVVSGGVISPSVTMARVAGYVRGQRQGRVVEVAIDRRRPISWRMELYDRVHDLSLADTLCAYLGVRSVWDGECCEPSHSLAAAAVLARVKPSAGDDSTFYAIDLLDVRPDAEFMTRFAPQIKSYREFMERPVCELGSTFGSEGLALERDSSRSLVNLLHGFQRSIFAADSALLRGDLCVSVVSLPEVGYAWSGPDVMVDEVGELVYSANRLVSVNLDAVQMDSLLEAIYDLRFYTLRQRGDDVVKYRVPARLHATVSGIKHQVNLTARRGHKVRITDTLGRKEYCVVLNSYLAQKFMPISVAPQAHAPHSSSEVVDHGAYNALLVRWLSSQPQPLDPQMWSEGADARLIPERWVL